MHLCRTLIFLSKKKYQPIYWKVIMQCHFSTDVKIFPRILCYRVPEKLKWILISLTYKLTIHSQKSTVCGLGNVSTVFDKSMYSTAWQLKLSKLWQRWPTHLQIHTCTPICKNVYDEQHWQEKSVHHFCFSNCFIWISNYQMIYGGGSFQR